MSTEDQTIHRKKSNKKNDQIRIKPISNRTKFTKP